MRELTVEELEVVTGGVPIIIGDEGIQIHSTFFFNRISVQPASGFRIVVTIAVMCLFVASISFIDSPFINAS